MPLDALKERLPEHARDLKLNLSTLARARELTPQQRLGTLLASAVATRNPEVLSAATAAAEAELSPEALRAARAAASIMAMNNVYYRFIHLVSDPEYARLPARLRMQVIGNPGVDKADFELWCLAVSAIHGCGACVDSHEQVVREAGLAREAVQAAVRIASVVHAIAVTLDAEAPEPSLGDAEPEAA